jgi:hypothetical protein
MRVDEQAIVDPEVQQIEVAEYFIAYYGFGYGDTLFMITLLLSVD